MLAKRPDAPKPPSKVSGVADALEALERRRRGTPARGKLASRRGDLDLDAIP